MLRDALLQLLGVIGTAAILSGFLAWLVKKLVSQWLTYDVEKYKSELKANADREIEQLKANANREIEQLKAALHIASVERQIVFSKLHEQRASVLAELYSLLYDLDYRAIRVVYERGMHEQVPSDLSEAVASALVNVRQIYYKNRIFLGEELCSLLDELLASVGYALDTGLARSDDSEVPERNVARYLEEFESLVQRLQRLRRAIETEFRQILGAA